MLFQALEMSKQLGRKKEKKKKRERERWGMGGGKGGWTSILSNI